MRRGLGAALAALGVLLVVAAALVRLVAAPALVKLPGDISSTTVSTGTVRLFVLSKQATLEVPVVATRTVRGDASASGGDVAVWNQTLCLRTASDGTARPDAAGCVPASDPAFVQRTTDRVALDRTTALAVAGHGSAVDGNAAVAHHGLSYTFPIGTQRREYPFFDTVVGAAFPMRYEGTEQLQGHQVYRFVQQVPSSPIKIQGLLPGTYADTRTVWVDPRTGVVVKGSEHIAQAFATTGQVVFDGTLAFDDATVRQQLAFADDQASRIGLIRLWLPLAALVVGLVLLVVGLLLARRRQQTPTPMPSPSPSLGRSEASGQA